MSEEAVAATLLAVGDNCLDVYVHSDVTYVGGNALNVAVNWHRAGHQAAYRGVVGDDPAAEQVVAEAHAQGLGRDAVKRLPGATGVTLVEMIDGDRHFAFEEFGVGASWQPDDSVVAQAQNADWVHVAGVDRSLGFVERLVGAGCRVSVDLSTFGETDGVQGCAVAFASEPAGIQEAWERAKELREVAGAETAIVTSGVEGAVAITASDRVHIPSVLADAIDTCGAGDSFIAATVAELAMGSELEAALRAGAVKAAATCEHVAGFPQEPRRTLGWIDDHYLAPRGYLGGDKTA